MEKKLSFSLIAMMEYKDVDGVRRIYSIRTPSGIYVDVMCKETGLIYVMQNEDGSLARDDMGRFMDVDIPEDELLGYVREFESDR